MAADKKLRKLELTEQAWEEHAPNATFFGLTLEQFKAKVQRSRDARALHASLKQQAVTVANQIKDTDKENLKIEQNVAKAIAGDENFGDDSDLFEGTGRIRKSERQTGLTRKKKNSDDNG